jgi:DeoR/GlpR family transcriptional regulator of sugar metabolism
MRNLTSKSRNDSDHCKNKKTTLCDNQQPKKQPMSDVDAAKKSAANKAVEFVKDGDAVGIGSGSTIVFVVEKLAERVSREGLKVCISTIGF